jgi:hypothetical protein
MLVTATPASANGTPARLPYVSLGGSSKRQQPYCPRVAAVAGRFAPPGELGAPPQTPTVRLIKHEANVAALPLLARLRMVCSVSVPADADRQQQQREPTISEIPAHTAYPQVELPLLKVRAVLRHGGSAPAE